MNRNVNPAIPESLQSFELECRIAAGEGDWDRLLQIGEVGTADERGFTLAYLLRSFMFGMKEQGILDDHFTRLCSELQKRGEYDLFRQYLDIFLTDEKTYEAVAAYTAPFIVLKGDRAFSDILVQFADDLASALEELGEDVIRIGGGEGDERLKRRMLCKGVAGFQAPALQNEFFRTLHGPKYQFWFDIPYFIGDGLRDLPDDYHVLCQDADHAACFRKYFGVKNAIQFFPGGSAADDITGDRPVDLLFLGNWFREDTDSLNDDERAFFSFLVSGPDRNYEEALLEFEPELAGERPERVLARLRELRNACAVARGYYRNEIVRKLLAAGLSVDVYGDGWNSFEMNGRRKVPGLIIHPPVAAGAAAEVYKRAKLSLNVMSWHKAGMTERISNSMLAGAVCVSDRTRYLEEHFRNGEELLLFRLDELDRVPAMVTALLEDDARRERVAAAAYKKAEKEYSWKARAGELVRLAEGVQR
ncbi:MAG: glycosyltransferase family 1 protein [Lachnospiraceae bacterium]|nr:glycosyltransferase family 1 protein [Lachnospiraceae bacterium]